MLYGMIQCWPYSTWKCYQEACWWLWMPKELFQAKESELLLLVGQAVCARIYLRVEEKRVAENWLSFPDSQVALAKFPAYSEAPHWLTFDTVTSQPQIFTLFLSTTLVFHSVSTLYSQEKIKCQVNSQFGTDSVCLPQRKEKPSLY